MGRVINHYQYRAGACQCAGQGARSVVWSFQINSEQRSPAHWQARPSGWRLKTGHAALQSLERKTHFRRTAPCLARFQAATRYW
ncbi:hypothetical protein CXP47_28805 [Pseudomonas chlororaphis]|nr:hypothetical protein CXP47_28805 [Pseudomonas chlororaphis]